QHVLDAVQAGEVRVFDAARTAAWLPVDRRVEVAERTVDGAEAQIAPERRAPRRLRACPRARRDRRAQSRDVAIELARLARGVREIRGDRRLEASRRNRRVLAEAVAGARLADRYLLGVALDRRLVLGHGGRWRRRGGARLLGSAAPDAERREQHEAGDEG